MSLSTIRNASMLVVLTIYSSAPNRTVSHPSASKNTLYQAISQLDADLFGARTDATRTNSLLSGQRISSFTRIGTVYPLGPGGPGLPRSCRDAGQWNQVQ